MIRRYRRNESLDTLTKHELVEILNDAKAYVDEEYDTFKDDIFRTFFEKYPTKTFGSYSIIEYSVYQQICRDIARHLKFVLGDSVGDFFDEEEYYTYMLKDSSYISDALKLIKELDYDNIYDEIYEVTNSFIHDNDEYMIIQVW